MSGIGLHSGETVHLILQPAPAGTGLVFRSPNRELGEITVSPFNVTATQNAVTLSNRKWQIQTGERLLAALATAGIGGL